MVASRSCGLALLAHCVAAATAALPYTGYLVDNYCWDLAGHVAFDTTPLGTEPGKHILHCMILAQCIPKGYALLEDLTTADADNYTYSIKYQLDDAGDVLALALVENEISRGGDRQLKEKVTVTGTLAGTTVNVETLCHTPESHTEICHGPALPYTGYLVDNFCWDKPNHIGIDATPLGTTPANHMLKCMFLPQCIPKGYALLTTQPTTAAWNSGFAYRIKFQLDDVGDKLAQTLVETEHARSGDRTFSEQVTVTGTLAGTTVSVATLCHTPPNHAKICSSAPSVVSGSCERRVWIGAVVALIYSISVCFCSCFLS